MELAEELRTKFPLFADLTDEELQWFLDQGEVVEVAAGELVFKDGDPAEHLQLFLSGEVQVRRPQTGVAAIFIGREGTVGGALPFSRMTHYSGIGLAVFPTRLFRFPRALFDELLRRIPRLGPRLIGAMTDRVRELTKADVQRDKLMALGKLSAGLAHELNNPASAARRAAETLRAALQSLRMSARRVALRELTVAQRQKIAELEDEAGKRAPDADGVDALTRSDQEEELASWLTARGVADAWKYAPALVEANVTPARVEPLLADIGADAFADVLERFANVLNVYRLADEIESATRRMSELVRSIKEYSYMDQAPVQEVNLHAGLESTLAILAHKLKTKNISVERRFAAELPPLQAYGGELNQVWTNLIDNAIDAMEPDGQLVIKTSPSRDAICVEVMDNGSGIPDEVRPHLFEPFFTTKGVGQGTGLGLDTVYRIVQKHHGDIQVDSKPGQTRFTIRLPLDLSSRLV
jgi:signal transduction histidine kinase